VRVLALSYVILIVECGFLRRPPFKTGSCPYPYGCQDEAKIPHNYHFRWRLGNYARINSPNRPRCSEVGCLQRSVCGRT
jgi:hypothetical protein